MEKVLINENVEAVVSVEGMAILGTAKIEKSWDKNEKKFRYIAKDIQYNVNNKKIIAIGYPRTVKTQNGICYDKQNKKLGFVNDLPVNLLGKIYN